MAMLTEEVGEVARIMARRYGEQSEKESDKEKDLGDELADVLFVLMCIANQTVWTSPIHYRTTLTKSPSGASLYGSIASHRCQSPEGRANGSIAVHLHGQAPSGRPYGCRQMYIPTGLVKAPAGRWDPCERDAHP